MFLLHAFLSILCHSKPNFVPKSFPFIENQGDLCYKQVYETIKRMSEAKSRINLRFVLLLVLCTELHAAVPFFPTYTNAEDVYAINKLYSALGSPPLSGWASLGGDPCYELWQGVQCTNNNITSIVLSRANLGGELQDDSLTNFTSILVLDLSNNSIGGTIPQNLPSTLQIFSLSGNQFTGSIPNTLSYLTSLSDLSLCENSLSGVLPDAFQSLTRLVGLKLSDNKLTGHLPPSMRYLTSLATMHVQNNELSGTLDVLQNLPLKDLNIAHNQFSGLVPENLLKIPNFQSDGNQLTITISPSTEDPPAAEGPVQQNSSPPPDYKPPLYHKRTVDAKAIAYAISIGSSIIIAIAILLVTICIPNWKAKRNAYLKTVEATMHETTQELGSVNITKQRLQKNQEAGGEVREQKANMADLQLNSADIEQPNPDEHQQIQRRLSSTFSIRSFSVAILQQYTNSFSEENLIKECSFGKLYLAEDEERKLYTVLKIEERKSKIQFDDFLRLVENVSKIEDSNILELVGYCAEYGQRLLVYRHFSNRTLNDIIHSHDHSMRTVPLSFSWTPRIQVALDAAKALEYLHGSQIPIVHRQFAPGNILLDDELRVRVSFCGLASSLPFISELQSHSPLALSYNAPEVNESENWSTKSDVYSFGVVMLQLLTGRESYDSTRPRAERHLAAWASYQLHDIDALVKMVDPALGGRFPIRSLSRVADIISRCIQEGQEFRPTMSEVVQDLTRALDADNVSSSIL